MRIKLNSQSFAYLEVYKVNYQFEKNNSGPVICRDCRETIGRGLGIHRQAYKRGGYVCFSCFAKDLVILTHIPFDDGDAGFFVDTLGRLMACVYLGRKDYSTPEIVEAVYKALLDEAYTTADILLGVEAAHPWKLLDAAEAAVGA